MIGKNRSYTVKTTGGGCNIDSWTKGKQSKAPSSAKRRWGQLYQKIWRELQYPGL